MEPATTGAAEGMTRERSGAVVFMTHTVSVIPSIEHLGSQPLQPVDIIEGRYRGIALQPRELPVGPFLSRGYKKYPSGTSRESNWDILEQKKAGSMDVCQL
jgi:hypothetical protein